jgi:hypothetical protein
VVSLSQGKKVSLPVGNLTCTHQDIVTKHTRYSQKTYNYEPLSIEQNDGRKLAAFKMISLLPIL